MLSLRRSTASQSGSLRSHPLDVWRSAAAVVWARWEGFREAPRETRSRAFAAYLAALDAEEAAASEIAAVSSATGH
jgi:hypothetical protein